MAVRRFRTGVRWMLNWPVRWILRRYGLPDLPEMRRVLRACARKGLTLGAAPRYREMLALHDPSRLSLSTALRTVTSATPNSLVSFTSDGIAWPAG